MDFSINIPQNDDPRSFVAYLLDKLMAAFVERIEAIEYDINDLKDALFLANESEDEDGAFGIIEEINNLEGIIKDYEQTVEHCLVAIAAFDTCPIDTRATVMSFPADNHKGLAAINLFEEDVFVSYRTEVTYHLQTDVDETILNYLLDNTEGKIFFQKEAREIDYTRYFK